jgi:hypothetical protein
MRWPYEVIYTELRWIQVNRRPLRYELRAGAAHEALVATLEWIPRAPVLGWWAVGYFYFSFRWEPWSWLRPRYVIFIQVGVTMDPSAPLVTVVYTRHAHCLDWPEIHLEMVRQVAT